MKNLFDYLVGASSLEAFLEDFPTVLCERGVTVLEAAQERSAEHDITTGFGLRSGRTCRDNFMATITLEITMIYTRLLNCSPWARPPSWLFVASQTLIGGSAHQTRIAYDLRELLFSHAISRVPAVCFPLLGGQNAGEGDNMRICLRPVGPSRCAADFMKLA